MSEFRTTPQLNSGWRRFSVATLFAFMTIGLVMVTLMLPTAFASAGHFAQFCFMVSWAGGFTAMWLNRNKRGYRPEDYWVAVSADGICVVSWRYTWKGHREVVEQFAYSSIASVTINDDIDMPPVTLELADGGSRAINHVMLPDSQQLSGFCTAIRHFSPRTVINDRGAKMCLPNDRKVPK